jgi:mRNA interferase MazF
MTEQRFRRGDLLWVNCEPSIGVEPKKLRTCVVVSNDVANQFGGAVTVIPTQRYSAERARREYMVDLRAPRSSLKDARVANASMVMTYDRSRIAKSQGRVTRETLAKIDDALRLHLALGGVTAAH